MIPSLELLDPILKVVGSGLGVGAILLLGGRLARKATGLATVLWVGGIVLSSVGILVAAGYVDVDFDRIRQTGRLVGDALRGLPI